MWRVGEGRRSFCAWEMYTVEGRGERALKFWIRQTVDDGCIIEES